MSQVTNMALRAASDEYSASLDSLRTAIDAVADYSPERMADLRAAAARFSKASHRAIAAIADHHSAEEGL